MAQQDRDVGAGHLTERLGGARDLVAATSVTLAGTPAGVESSAAHLSQ